jgi:hypothetical protein
MKLYGVISEVKGSYTNGLRSMKAIREITPSSFNFI